MRRGPSRSSQAVSSLQPSAAKNHSVASESIPVRTGAMSSVWPVRWMGPALPWGGASVSSGLGSAGASIGHHASVNDVRESAFEAAQRLVPTLASGEFATEVAVAFGARHARLGERRDVERPVQLAQGAVVDRGSVATTADSGHCGHVVGPAGEARS